MTERAGGRGQSAQAGGADGEGGSSCRFLCCWVALLRVVALVLLPGASLAVAGEGVDPPKADVAAGPAAEVIDLAPSRPLLEWFAPNHRAFAPLWADPRDARFQMGFLYDADAAVWWDVTLGGDLLVASGSLLEPGDLTFSGRGLISSRFQFFSESFDLYNTDFIGGGTVGFRHGPLAAELMVYHQSSHLGDEILERGQRPRIDYGREAARLMASYGQSVPFDLALQQGRTPSDFAPGSSPSGFVPGLRVYAGAGFNVRADPEALEQRWTLQAGAQEVLRIGGVPLYGAIDLQSKQENGWRLNTSVQVGTFLGRRGGLEHRQRLCVAYYDGYSSMGQFHGVRERFIQLCLAY